MPDTMLIPFASWVRISFWFSIGWKYFFCVELLYLKCDAHLSFKNLDYKRSKKIKTYYDTTFLSPNAKMSLKNNKRNNVIIIVNHTNKRWQTNNQQSKINMNNNVSDFDNGLLCIKCQNELMNNERNIGILIVSHYDKIWWTNNSQSIKHDKNE